MPPTSGQRDRSREPGVPELHIASCVAFVKPEFTAAVVRAVESTGLAEVPRHGERGRAVLLIERKTSRQVLDVIDAVRAMHGVLAVHIAYPHAEPDLHEPS